MKAFSFNALLSQKNRTYLLLRKPRRRKKEKEEEALQLFQTVLVNPSGCVSCIKLRQRLKDFFGLESSSVLSLGIWSDLRSRSGNDQIKILRFPMRPTPLKPAAAAVTLTDSQKSVKLDMTKMKAVLLLGGSHPFLHYCLLVHFFPHGSALGRIQLAGTHCGSSCALLTAVSSWTHESCSSSLTIIWSKNCQYWDSIFRAESSISWKSSSWGRKQVKMSLAVFLDSAFMSLQFYFSTSICFLAST